MMNMGALHGRIRDRPRWFRRESPASILTACGRVKQQKVSGLAFSDQKPHSMHGMKTPMLRFVDFAPRNLVKGQIDVFCTPRQLPQIES